MYLELSAEDLRERIEASGMLNSYIRLFNSVSQI